MAQEIPKGDLVIHGVPKPILAFAEKYAAVMAVDLQEFWQQEIISVVDSLITLLEGDYFDRDTLVERHGLKAILEPRGKRKREEQH